MSRYSAISAVSRAARVLELLAERPKGVSVTELAETLRAGKPIVSRVLATLAEAGYVCQDRLRLLRAESQDPGPWPSILGAVRVP